MKKIVIALTLFFLLMGCAPNEETLSRYSNSSITSGFDTTMTLLAYTQDEEEFNKYFEMMKSSVNLKILQNYTKSLDDEVFFEKEVNSKIRELIFQSLPPKK